MPTCTYVIKGAYFRPPAKALLDSLPVGASLTLMHEPGGPDVGHDDPTAIAVWLASATLGEASRERLRTSLGEFGSSLEDVLDQEWHHCGYIPKEMAAQLMANGFPEAPAEVPAEFSVSARGAPMVRFEFDPDR